MSYTTQSFKPGLDRRHLCVVALATSLLAVTAAPVMAEGALSKPRGEVVLSLTGNVKNTNAEDRVDFDMAQLEAMPKVVFTTTTPWTEGETRFEGVLLKHLLQIAGAEGSSLKAIALNDYASELPFSDAKKHRVIVAYKSNGEYMPVRAKGPLWVVYPFDDKPELKSEQIYARSVWQLRKISVN
jgi:hypothetical protein